MRLNNVNLPKLTLPPGKLEAIVFDDALAGFGVRIRAGGKRTWVAQYRLGTKQRRISIGSLEKIDADEARRRAKEIFAKVQLGQDPSVEKVDAVAQASITLGATADRFLERHASKRLKPKGLGETTLYLKRHWGPLRELPLQKVRLQHVASRLRDICEDNGPYAANRARAALSSLYTWAIGEGLADINPVVGTNKPAVETKRDRVLSDEELALVWQCSGGGDFGTIVKLLILTGQRREEVGAAQWPEIDPAGALWTIPGNRTKNRLPHDVPLAAPALKMWDDQARRDGRDLIFGSRNGPFQGWSDAKEDIDQRIAQATGGKSLKPWRLHDLRRTVATRLGDLGVLPHVVEAVLNHISGSKAGVAGVYNRALYNPEKREALDRWSAKVADIVGDR